MFNLKNNIIIMSMVNLILSTILFAQVQTDVPALKDVFANDFKIGCLLSYAHIGFSTDPYVPGQSGVVDQYGGYLIKHHMNSMSPGNWMKPAYTVDISASAAAYSAASVQEDKDSIDIHPIVKFNGNITAQLNWAKRQGFTFRGHTLVWHNQTPGTAFFRSGYVSDGRRLTKEEMTQRMRYFLKEVFRTIHEGWPGLLSAMDVVNEAINDNGTDRTQNNEWYTTFGDMSYVMKAFEFAREYTELYGETQIKLYYNDYNTHLSAKADGIVGLCEPIYQAGYLDGIGMQDHDQYNSPSAQQWIATYNKFYPICSEMSVTEFDVKPSSDNLTESVLKSQANQYANLFKCFLDRSAGSGRGKLVSVSKDGLNDYWAFVKNASLWDENDQCKPAYYEIVLMAQNYRSLDSLLAVADSLNQPDYTADSWQQFQNAYNEANLAMEANYSYSLSAADALGTAKDNLQAAMDNLVISRIEPVDHSGFIQSYALMQNYPNPFNPNTTIRFSLPVNSQVMLTIYDVLGKKTRTLLNSRQNSGIHSVVWNGLNDAGLTVSGGIYIYKLETENFCQMKKMIFIR